MKVFKVLPIRVAALFLLLALIGLNIKSRYATSQPSILPAREIPPGGLIDNDTNGKVPGNPQNAVEDFTKIYAAIETFRGQNNGQYPPKILDVLKVLNAGLKSTDIEKIKTGIKASYDTFLNPDAKYSDDPLARRRPNDVIKYNLYNKRPDGTLVGNPPSGKKDLLMETSLYVHQNVRTLPGQRSVSNPVGFYVVLWHDGTIQRIAYDQVLYMPKGGGDFTRAFPGQAGVPANALTYDEFYRLSGWKKGPRGMEGGKGQSYNDKLPR
ncbi:hypothetical protein B1R32_12825 [Abditibacterium utsteinense]|uniref:Uncharacterized protein n=1 Tax=Abditibacterium utsteinense TaxID=1960156 RepID=A0A2S8SP66_9BACT|nr:hypothetical protein [Abditibacterium utsteinense]PQV62587.1 hypothetical protein B1R32_12825 [Abditibacterium utsteinense]